MFDEATNQQICDQAGFMKTTRLLIASDASSFTLLTAQ